MRFPPNYKINTQQIEKTRVKKASELSNVDMFAWALQFRHSSQQKSRHIYLYIALYTIDWFKPKSFTILNMKK